MHHADHWYALCFSPRQASLQSEQMYAPLDQLYRQAVREVQHALAAFRNPWIPAPRCLCVSMQRDILYHGTWHQVWIHQKEQYFLRLVDLYTLGLAHLLSLLTVGSEATAWRGQVQTLLEEVERLKARYQDVAFDSLQALDQELSRYERALQAALLSRQGGPVLDEVKAYHVSFSQLRAILWERMHQLLIHELLHAWSRRKRRFGDRESGWYYQQGVERFDAAYARAHASRPSRQFLHWAMNEAIGDWIMLRISGGPALLRWQRVILPADYSHWIINDIAAALDALWERVSAVVPALCRKGIRTAQDLFYAIFFRDPDLSVLLEQGLAVATGDLQAFALLDLACERFTLDLGSQTTAEAAHLQQSLADVQRLLGPYSLLLSARFPSPSGWVLRHRARASSSPASLTTLGKLSLARCRTNCRYGVKSSLKASTQDFLSSLPPPSIFTSKARADRVEGEKAHCPLSADLLVLLVPGAAQCANEERRCRQRCSRAPTLDARLDGWYFT